MSRELCSRESVRAKKTSILGERRRIDGSREWFRATGRQHWDAIASWVCASGVARRMLKDLRDSQGKASREWAALLSVEGWRGGFARVSERVPVRESWDLCDKARLAKGKVRTECEG